MYFLCMSEREQNHMPTHVLCRTIFVRCFFKEESGELSGIRIYAWIIFFLSMCVPSMMMTMISPQEKIYCKPVLSV